ncbi:MAG TPA: DinB family protein [Chthonomonadaceae bacterium]|nr:DinB family protein [Chthonomonadaceae bacterium]
MAYKPHTENEAYELVLCGHLESFVARLRQLPPDKWDWTPDQAAPTARILAAHTWQWLQCDRQHIAEPDASKHTRIPEPPADPQAMCDAMQEETEQWRALLRGLTPEQFETDRVQFNGNFPMNIRSFVCHMIQNTIYKHGQFTTLYFALGLDGTEAYTAPFPNPIYEELFRPAKS